MVIARLVSYCTHVLLMHRGALGLILTFLFSFGFTEITFAAFDDQSVFAGDSAGAPPNIGNFALPSPQQPGPLLSFGQTLIGKNYLQLSFDTYSPYPNGGAFNSLNTAFTYGISDSTALYFNYPIRADVQTRVHRTSPLRDVNLQLEHAFYVTGNTKYQEQATVLGAVTIPTNDETTLHAPKGYGSPTFFWGATYNRTYVDWLGFVSPGIVVTTNSDSIRLGSQFLYQAGIGRNILSVSGESMLFGLLEFNGQYTAQDHVFGRLRPNTGGNVITLTPSLWFSTQRLIAQVGVGFPIVQNLYGNQTKMNYFIVTSMSWTIG